MSKTMYANVNNDGGFEFGMDYTTPVSWTFGRKLSRAYTSLILPDYMAAWTRENKHWIGSYRDLQRVVSEQRASA